jgi:hypothetical protein
MTKGKYVTIVTLCTALGFATGIVIANWKFTDPDVLRAARILLGVVGAIVGGFGSKWLIIGRGRESY